MSKPLANAAEQQFNTLLDQILQLEKLIGKAYLKFEKTAFTDELAKCLSPTSTDGPAHLQRLKLITASFATNGTATEKLPALSISIGKKSMANDLQLIAVALGLQNQKLAIYEMLHPLASGLALTPIAQLIEQTITDNRNTNTWLRQIIQNIIVPKLQTGS